MVRIDTYAPPVYMAVSRVFVLFSRDMCCLGIHGGIRNSWVVMATGFAPDYLIMVYLLIT